MTHEEDHIALVDLDGTVADCDGALKEAMETLCSPGEPAYADRYTDGTEPSYIEARRKMVQRQPGFWRNLKKIPLGFEVVEELRKTGFQLHVLSKGPRKNGSAWGEKLEWSIEHLPDATVTVTGDKSISYGRVLFDDFPPYFLAWLKVHPRGLVICLAHPWNKEFEKGGSKAHPNVIRYDGTDVLELREALVRARDRLPREPLGRGAPTAGPLGAEREGLHVPKAGRCDKCGGSGEVVDDDADVDAAKSVCPICKGTGSASPDMQFRVAGP